MPDEVRTAIEENAVENLKRVQTKDQQVEVHPLPDLIAADKYLSGNTQARSTGRLVFNKISPPGAA